MARASKHTSAARKAGKPPRKPARKPPRKPARPRPNARRQILDEAQRLFAEKGYAAASMRELASRCQVNVALAYHHFGSKEAVYRALVERYIEGLDALDQAFFARLGQQWGSPQEACVAVLDGFLRHAVENADFVRILVHEVLDPSREHSELSRQLLLPAWDKAVSVLQSGADSGVFRQVEPRSLILIIFGAIAYYVAAHQSLQRLLGEDPLASAATERYRDELTAMVLARLGLPPV